MDLLSQQSLNSSITEALRVFHSSAALTDHIDINHPYYLYSGIQ